MALRSSIPAACIFPRFGRILAVLVCALALFSCTGKQNRILAEVGRFTITAGDAKYRDELIQVFYPGSKEPNAGFLQLREVFIQAQVLENNGVKFGDDALDREAARIDKETQAPATLEKIKAIFAKNPAAYRKIFVLPTLVERTIYFDFFLHNPQVQAGPIAAVKALLAAQPAGLSGEAKKRGLAQLELEYEASRGFFKKGQAVLEQKPANEASARALGDMRQKALDFDNAYFLKHAAEIQAGKPLGEPLDRGEVWLVLQPKKKGGKIFSAFVVPKISYEDWLQAEQKKVTVREFSQN